MSICGELLTRSPARDNDGAVDPNSHYRQKRESRASLDLFINGILVSRGNRWRMSKKIKTHRRTQEWIDAQAAACQGTPPEARAAALGLVGAAVRGADSATTSGGDARRSCRIEVRSSADPLCSWPSDRG